MISSNRCSAIVNLECFFTPKNIKSENNDPWFKPWFNILQSIVCATLDSQCLEYTMKNERKTKINHWPVLLVRRLWMLKYSFVWWRFDNRASFWCAALHPFLHCTLFSWLFWGPWHDFCRAVPPWSLNIRCKVQFRIEFLWLRRKPRRKKLI